MKRIPDVPRTSECPMVPSKVSQHSLPFEQLQVFEIVELPTV